MLKKVCPWWQVFSDRKILEKIHSRSFILPETECRYLSLKWNLEEIVSKVIVWYQNHTYKLCRSMLIWLILNNSKTSQILRHFEANIMSGVIHKPCGQIFWHFCLPPPLWTYLLNRGYVVKWTFGKPPSPLLRKFKFSRFKQFQTWKLNSIVLITRSGVHTKFP